MSYQVDVLSLLLSMNLKLEKNLKKFYRIQSGGCKSPSIGKKVGKMLLHQNANSTKGEGKGTEGK
jgi:hypothetical protein